LDIGHPTNLHTLRARHHIAQSLCNHLDRQDFIEVAFLVPTHQKPGFFYAFSQSSSHEKHMLLVAGVECHYSLPSCFLDELWRSGQ
jgi:aspartyl-tRNA synthetase